MLGVSRRLLVTAVSDAHLRGRLLNSPPQPVLAPLPQYVFEPSLVQRRREADERLIERPHEVMREHRTVAARPWVLRLLVGLARVIWRGAHQLVPTCRPGSPEGRAL